MNKVDQVKVNIARKINIGSYENIDYGAEITISGFDGKDLKKVKDALKFGRDICAEDVSSYYKKIKSELEKGEPLSDDIDKKYLDLEKRIRSSENEEQLRTLEDSVMGIEDDSTQKKMSKLFNLRLIALRK